MSASWILLQTCDTGEFMDAVLMHFKEFQRLRPQLFALRACVVNPTII
jgi:hypothetical protein